MYKITLQNIKQSVKNMGEFLTSKGYAIPHTTLLHALSKALFFPNWNTLQAHCLEPEDFQAHEYYVLRFQSNQNAAEVVSVLKQSATKANCCLVISHPQQYSEFLEIRFTNPLVKVGNINYSNLAVALMFFSQYCIDHNWKVGRLEYWHERVEKQDFVKLVHEKKPHLKM